MDESTVDDKRKRFQELGWQVLEHKCRYYVFMRPIISDFEYDMIEKEYDALAKELGVPPTASDMVDFDDSRPSCRLVLDKLRGVKYEDLKNFVPEQESSASDPDKT